MLQGYVDMISLDKRKLTGWVQLGRYGEEPHLQLGRHGDHAGSVIFGSERPDVRAARGIANTAFTLTFEDPLDIKSFILKTLQVTATVDGEISTIPLSSSAEVGLIADFVKQAATNTAGAREAILEALHIPDFTLSKHIDEVRETAESGDLSYIAFPVGLRSSNDVAQIGRDGHLFLTGGNNALRDQYVEPKNAAEQTALEEKAQRWVSTIRSTSRALNDMGIPFLQIVIPEKLTALRHLAPLPISGPTPLYRRVNELMDSTPDYLSFLDMFDNWSGDIEGWQRNDTHCSPAGSLAMARSILERLPDCHPGVLAGIELTGTVYRDGDLSAKFFDIPLWDRQHVPAPGSLDDSEIELAYSYNPGNFVDSHNIWINNRAPIKKKVLVFGNSFFGGVTSPTRLGWWFARLFSEYNMKWVNTVDMDLVKDVRPDFVIAQTIERFMVRPPEPAS
ncbi:hypothetical protein GCM10009825_30600 [Arthrobacter humicola]|uniref:AlgX/AlgJ SGNH hydrolase-like domain-containing protein n=2 Tax=Arthrobacter humicola TaxID=409291 RepID=A0ABP5L4N1_9MICC